MHYILISPNSTSNTLLAMAIRYCLNNSFEIVEHLPEVYSKCISFPDVEYPKDAVIISPTYIESPLRPCQELLHIPIGYCEMYEEIFRQIPPNSCEKDINVLFIGQPTPFQVQFLNGVCICNTDNIIDKSVLIHRSKIILSLASSSNDLMKLAFFISNGACVIAEKFSDQEIELKMDIPFFESVDEMQSLIVKLLENDYLRIKISTKSKKSFQETFPFRDHLIESLKNIKFI